jgi:aminoglycoside 6-adenylyltransferase
MNATPSTYEQLETNIITWAHTRPDMRAGIVVGSRARTDHPADQWSDLDLLLFTTTPDAYAADPAWLAQIGEVWVPLFNVTGRGDPEWLILFAGGLKADFVFTAASASLQQAVDASPYDFVLRRGARVLFDKDGPPTPLTLPELSSQINPMPDAFLAAVHGFLMEAGRAARFLRRGERWPAKMSCDGALKQRLLEMIVWHAQTRGDAGNDIWHGGRFLEEWADPRALEALPNTFAAYDTDDLWRALLATLDLFRWLARETAERWGYPYPTRTDQRMTAWLFKRESGEFCRDSD